jgi:PPOX class probable F420-dependent enzyme
MREMTDTERRGFLLEGTRTGKLAVTRRDGSPYVLPVWFLLHGDTVIFMTGADTVRGRALRRDGRASMLVDEDRPPYAFVRVDGRVELSEDLEEMLPWSRALAARYMGEDAADAFGARNAVRGELLVRLVPDRVVAWAEVSA